MAFLHHSIPGRLTALTIGVVSVAGCLNRPLEPADPRTTSTVSEKLPRSRVDKIDLLLMIDNSSSMADKQAILAEAVPDLVRGLASPPCVDAQGVPVKSTPASPTEKCPAGTEREFEPVLDMHIGIISSSLGGHGNPASCPVSGLHGSLSNDDRAHLLARKDASLPLDPGNVIETYQGKGFLAWDPAQKRSPAGIKDIGDTMGTPGLVPTLHDMVKGVGQEGCGYEAQLESWYRFLVDPEPYDTISIQNGKAVLQGKDELLLTQRAAFLRPDSLVAVIMLTDENDCSFIDGGSNYVYADHTKTLPGEGQNLANLRCYHAKERFGVDFLQPLDRYINGLTSAKVPSRAGELMDNPLYPSVASSGVANPRTPDTGLVFLAGIVGVPWQDIARKDAQGKPDLLHGLDPNRRPVGGFMSARELSQKGASGATGWDQILGDPATSTAPLDALMIESDKPRTGLTPATGDPLASSSAPSPTANPINGHEWTPEADLQFACTFKLPVPQPGACDAADIAAHNPLCQDEATGQYTTTRYRAKGYPGVRELGVLRGVGDQGIVASVCPADLSDPTSQAYGYRPAIGAIVDRLKQKLGGLCLHRSLTPDVNNQVSCLIVEARKTEPGQCSCDEPDVKVRQDVQHHAAMEEALADPAAQAAGWNCFCEIKQLSGGGLTACQSDASRSPLTSGGQTADGWCYIDTTTGNASLVESCAATEQHKIRFVGAGEQLPGATLFITCAGE